MRSIGMRFVKHQDCSSKPKRCKTPFGAGYIKYQPEIIVLHLFHAKHMFLWQTNSIALTHRHPHISVTAFIAHVIYKSQLQHSLYAEVIRPPQIIVKGTVTALMFQYQQGRLVSGRRAS